MGIQERKEREFKRREQDILKAALELFTSDEWQDATIEQIAQRAEIGKGTVYKHFASKDEIYARLALDFHERLIDDLRRIDSRLGVLERLRQVIRCIWKAHRAMGPEHQRVVQYFNREEFWHGLSDATRAEIAARQGELDALIAEVVQRGIDEGLFPDKPIPLLTYGAEATVMGAIQRQWRPCAPAIDPEQYLEEITCFILAGMMYQDDVPGPSRATQATEPRGARQHAEHASAAAAGRGKE